MAVDLPVEGYELGVDAIKPAIHRFKSLIDLLKASVDLFEAFVDLLKPLVNLLEAFVDLLEPPINLLEAFVDLFELLIDESKSFMHLVAQIHDVRSLTVQRLKVISEPAFEVRHSLFNRWHDAELPPSGQHSPILASSSAHFVPFDFTRNSDD